MGTLGPQRHITRVRVRKLARPRKTQFAEGIPVAPLTGDVLIIRLVDGTFSVSAVRGKSLGRTYSERDPLALAFSHKSRSPSLAV